jgi:uncharacterized membrane protein YedE/YeeE
MAETALALPYSGRSGLQDRRPQWGMICLTLMLALAGAVIVAGDGWRMTGLFLVGLTLGLALYQASFGFTGAYRRLFTAGEVAGIRAQLLLVGATTLLFAPVLAAGSAFGQPVSAAEAPLSLSVAIGALIFGCGMQLAGGCGSGTLFTIGGGSPRMVVTLVAFCAGSFWASLDLPWWDTVPSAGTIVLGERLGWLGGVVLQLTLLAILWLGLGYWGAQARRGDGARPWWRLALQGPWPLTAGAAVLAAGNLATLLLAGRPWGITWGFTLWGAKIAQLAGWDPAAAPYWRDGDWAAALGQPVTADVTSVMDVAIIIGALLAAAMAGRFAPIWRVPARSLAAAVIGGLMLGYGARISFGCNIGAFVSGAASTSLHGWLWVVAALVGTSIGVRLRPWFALLN